VPDAVPRDELQYGFVGGAGLVIDARPFEMWRGRLHLLFGSELVEAVTAVSLADLGGDGDVDTVDTSTTELARSVVQEATVTFQPVDVVGARVGAMRIPFTLQQQSANTALLFTTRSTANEVFTSGSDLGALIYGDVWDSRILASIGVFNGDSLGLLIEDAERRSVALSVRTDINPFGAFPFGEGDHRQGPFRLGVGFGLLYSPGTLFDERTGTEPHAVHDTRIAASLRMAVHGLYVAAEYFRRQQADDFSFRPRIADGAYGQLAFFFRIANRVGLEPVARVGFTADDQAFDPRFIGYTDAGFNVYPEASDGDDPDRLKITLNYVGERRFTEDEDAHGAAIGLQLEL